MFRAEHVGSLLRPAALIEARSHVKQDKIDAAALRTIEDGAIPEVVALHEQRGFAVVTDGEFRRENW